MPFPTSFTAPAIRVRYDLPYHGFFQQDRAIQKITWPEKLSCHYTMPPTRIKALKTTPYWH